MGVRALNWFAFIWKGSRVVFVIEDSGSYIIWDDFGDLKREMGSDSKSKIVDIFDSLDEAKEFVEKVVGRRVEVIS